MVPALAQHAARAIAAANQFLPLDAWTHLLLLLKLDRRRAWIDGTGAARFKLDLGLGASGKQERQHAK